MNTIIEAMDEMPFQFHYGTIKRLFGNVNVNTFADFNSIMVRLKAE